MYCCLNPHFSILLRRHRARLLLLLLVALLFWLSGSSSSSGSPRPAHRDVPSKAGGGGPSSPGPLSGPRFRPLPCKVNAQVMNNIGGWKGEEPESVQCLARAEEAGLDEEDVFVPFSFVKKYFDIYGEVKTSDGGNRTWLDWSHSYSRAFPRFGQGRYSFNGTFLQFEDFDVEQRSRVKCVSAAEGVPISTQWDKAGYFYSTQISQFGLSHWSKAARLRTIGEEGLDEKSRKRLGGNARLVLEDGDRTEADWKGDVTRVTSLGCVHFDGASAVSLALDFALPFSSSSKETGVSPQYRVLSWSLQYKQDAVVSVTLKSRDLSYVLRYVPEDLHVDRDGNVISYGYGSGRSEGEWVHFARDLLQDLQKGVSKKGMHAFKRGGPVVLAELRLEGFGCVANVSLAEQEHLRMFFSAADWLVRSQDSSGGWPVTGVVFNAGRSKYPGAEEVPRGWHSAMASGHALSVLARAYSASMQRRYLERAFAALELFSTSSAEGGFQATFMDKLVWYEEYPTSPPTFVLNGFMYSLLGLFDLKDALEVHELTGYAEYRRVSVLFSSGLSSLRRMLPLYDTGQGSLYDLRHLTGAGGGVGGAVPKPARWDYHAAHVNLLYALSTTTVESEDREFLAAAAERWRGYMLGKRAPHN